MSAQSSVSCKVCLPSFVLKLHQLHIERFGGELAEKLLIHKIKVVAINRLVYWLFVLSNILFIWFFQDK